MPASAGTAIGSHGQQRWASPDVTGLCQVAQKIAGMMPGPNPWSRVSATRPPPDPIVPIAPPALPLSPCPHGARRALRVAIAVAAIDLAHGCAAAPTPTTPTTPTTTAAAPEARVIVRFRPGSPDPSDAAFRARLASSARLSRIDLLHPMSGGAYVMTIGCADPNAATTANPPDACAAAIRRLGASAWIASIDNDRREKHQ